MRKYLLGLICILVLNACGGSSSETSVRASSSVRSLVASSVESSLSSGVSISSISSSDEGSNSSAVSSNASSLSSFSNSSSNFSLVSSSSQPSSSVAVSSISSSFSSSSSSSVAVSSISSSIGNSSSSLSSISSEISNSSLSASSLNSTSSSSSSMISGNLAQAFALWRDEVQPLIASSCSNCHMGERFNVTSLKRNGSAFTEAETATNYTAFLDMISLDNPALSRLLVKGLPTSDADAIHHGAGPQFSRTDTIYTTLLNWIETEKSARCPDCGISASTAYIAYVQNPEVHWMLQASPTRTDRGVRAGAKIMLQKINAGSLDLIGSPIDFLDNSFCPNGDDCDYGHLAVSHAGDKLAFECRISVAGEAWLHRSWNLCIANIGSDGKAQNPRFLKPQSERFSGQTQTRTTPFGIPDGNSANPEAISPYNKHYLVRQRNDRHPIFSPDDQRLYFSSQSPDPRTGDDMVESYHGSFHLKHLVSSNLEGGDLRTIMRNEGGTVDFPFFRKNGNVAAHVWNLERMDSHLYAQATADGMMELPVLMGRIQGPNNWGKAFEMVNGLIVGMTGRRRGELENYAPFFGDHTVGVQGIDPGLAGFQGMQIIDSNYHEEIGNYPQGYCPSGVSPAAAKTTKNCFISKLVLDSNWTPFAQALVSYNPEKTYIGLDERFVGNHVTGSNPEQRQASGRPYFPKNMGVGLYDLNGESTVLIPNAPGTYTRYPVWVGKHQPPKIQEQKTNENVNWAELHIADVPVWLTFGMGTNGNGSKRNRYNLTKETVALRILRKVSDSNACISDSRYIVMSNFSSNGMHPTSLGGVDATGWEQFVVPVGEGGNVHGDIPLKADGSVRVRIPAGELMWMVGINTNGHISAHRRRVSAFPPGHRIDTGVKASQYDAQCARCHASLGITPMSATRDISSLPPGMDFNTTAAIEAIVDLTAPSVTTRELTYKNVIRPMLDTNCVSCHTGENAAGELSFDSEYSITGNYPKGSWVDQSWSAYRAFMGNLDPSIIEPSYNYTPTYSFVFRADQSNYKDFYAAQMSTHETIGELAPWDPGYQNLFMKRHYVNSRAILAHIGRVPQEGGNARHSFLLEVLTGQNWDSNHEYSGYDHTSILDEEQIRTLAAVLDTGMPYMARCSDAVVPVGVNAGSFWGEAVAAKNPVLE